MSWDEAKEAMLRELWAAGDSGAEIADKINARFGDVLTRNAVISKRIRMGIPDRPPPSPKNRERLQVKRRRKSKPFVLFNQLGQIDATSRKQLPIDGFVPPVDPPAPLHQRKTVVTLGKDDCRWPIGDPQSPSFHFCGAESVPGKPYCSIHVRRAYQQPPLRAREFQKKEAVDA